MRPHEKTGPSCEGAGSKSRAVGPADKPILADTRRDGMDRADWAADVAWRRAADTAIKTLAGTGRPFTADDLVALVGPPVAPSGKAMGPRFSHAAQAGVIRPVGYRESSRVSGRILRSWTGVPS